MYSQYFFDALKTFVIPDNVTKISKAAFPTGEWGEGGITSIRTIYIPRTVTTIEANAFSALSMMYYDNPPKVVFEAAENEIPAGYPWGYENYYGGDYVLFEYGKSFEHVADGGMDLKYLIENSYPSNYVLRTPEGCTNYGYKFVGSNIKSLYLTTPMNYSTRVCTDCQQLETVVITDIISDVYDSLFYNCPNIKTIYCKWKQGTHPAAENAAPWGAPSNCTVVYDYQRIK
jgi:hypothetical protein